MRLLIACLSFVLLVTSTYGEQNPKCHTWSRKFDLCLKRGFKPLIFKDCEPNAVEKKQDYCIRFERFLNNPRNECNYKCGFTPVQRTIKADFTADLALEVRTNSENGSQDKMYMYFQDAEEEWAGAFLVLFSRTPSYQIGWCYQNWEVFPDTLPEAQEKIWTFYRTLKGVKVECNGVEVLDIELDDEVCDRTNLNKPWNVFWSREISQFYFPEGDTASISYRVAEQRKRDDMEEEERLCAGQDSICPRNPCESMSCPRYPDAQCLPMLCGCSAMFRHDDGSPIDDCDIEEEGTVPMTEVDMTEVEMTEVEMTEETTLQGPIMCETCTDVYALVPGGGETLMPSFDSESSACGLGEQQECMSGFTCGTHKITYSMDVLQMKVVTKGCIHPSMTCENLVAVSQSGMSGNMKFELCDIEITGPVEEEQSMCPDGLAAVQCFINPCDITTCKHSDATCVANYCGGCHAMYFSEEGTLYEDCPDQMS